MHVLREIFRQKLALARTHRQIVASLGVSLGKVSGALARASAIGLDAVAIEQLTDDELEAALYPKAVAAAARAVPDCAALHIELRRPKVTLALLHVEFREQHPDGIGYSAFCDRYREWAARRSPVMRQQHVAGDKLFVDYAGMRPRLTNAVTGEVTDVELFVAVLGASNYTFAEATYTQRVADFAGSLTRALTFIRGVPNAIVPDQLKSAVASSCRYEPGIQRTTAELGRHYGTTVLPARPKSPRDKAKVEVGVQIAERWLLARIRDETFHSLGVLNARLAVLVADLNGRVMRTYKASRRDLFERLDRPALSPLPDTAFEVSTWKEVSLNVDYHFELDHHLYSAPQQLIRERVWIRATATTVEVLHGGKRVASHVRSYVRGGRTTVPEHMPSTHRAHAEWTPSRILGWAEQEVGPNARALCEVILRDRRHPEWGFRSCLGLLRLAKKYGNTRVDKASLRALFAGARSYRHVKTILQHNLDGAALPEAERPAPTASTHENIRGSEYYHLSIQQHRYWQLQKGFHVERTHARKAPCPPPAHDGLHVARARQVTRRGRAVLRRSFRHARGRRGARPRQRPARQEPARRQAAHRRRLHRGDRLPAGTAAGEGHRAAARDVPLGYRAPHRHRHRRDRDGQELPRLRPCPPSLPQGLPYDVPTRPSPL